MAKKFEDKLNTFLLRCAYEDKALVKKVILDVFHHDNNVELNMGSYYDEDGLEYPELLQLKAVSPIASDTTLTPIPLEIYITYNFPIQPPVVFVRSGRDMMLKGNHPDVGKNGLLSISYIDEWNSNHDGKSIAELLDHVKVSFAEHGPPLVKKRTGLHVLAATATSTSTSMAPPSAITTPYDNRNNHPISTKSQHSASTMQGDQHKHHSYNETLLDPYSHSVVDKLQVYQSPIGTHSSASAEKRQRMLTILNSRIKNDLREKLWNFYDSSDKEIKTGEDLQNKLDFLKGEHKASKDQTEKLKETLLNINSQKSELDKIRLENEKKGSTEVDIESKLIPSDPLSLQLLTLDAEVKALDDAIISLSHPSSSNDNINLSKLLSSVRELSSKRFMKEAHIRKIRHQIALRSGQFAPLASVPQTAVSMSLQSSYNPNMNANMNPNAVNNQQVQYQKSNYNNQHSAYNPNISSNMNQNMIATPPPPSYSFPTVPAPSNISIQHPHPPAYSFPSAPQSSASSSLTSTTSSNQKTTQHSV